MGLLLYVIFGVLFLYSVVVHELAHGYVAYLLGDDTAYRRGRLTLNPLAHLDPVGSVILPAVLFLLRSPYLIGYAKPVPINPLNFTRVRNLRLGVALCSLAGPSANLLLAFVFCKMARFSFNPSASVLFLSLGGVNVVLALFNLLPIPGFDGGHILSALLPPSLYVEYRKWEGVGFILALVLLMTGVVGMVIFPVAEVILRWLC